MIVFFIYSLWAKIGVHEFANFSISIAIVIVVLGELKMV